MSKLWPEHLSKGMPGVCAYESPEHLLLADPITGGISCTGKYFALHKLFHKDSEL